VAITTVTTLMQSDICRSRGWAVIRAVTRLLLRRLFATVESWMHGQGPTMWCAGRVLALYQIVHYAGARDRPAGDPADHRRRPIVPFSMVARARAVGAAARLYALRSARAAAGAALRLAWLFRILAGRRGRARCVGQRERHVLVAAPVFAERSGLSPRRSRAS
jgi:hypothetical protein